MLKNLKNITIGFIIGLSVFSILPVKAAIEEYILYKADYKIIVNSKEFNDPDYPILNYKGTTYISIRKAAEALGVNLQWNADLGQAEINNTVSADVYTTPTTHDSNIVVNKALQNYQKDNISIYIFDNKEYIYFKNIMEKYPNQCYFYLDKGILSLYKSEYDFVHGKQPFLTNIDYKLFHNYIYINYEYYISNLKNIIEEQ